MPLNSFAVVSACNLVGKKYPSQIKQDMFLKVYKTSIIDTDFGIECTIIDVLASN